MSKRHTTGAVRSLGPIPSLSARSNPVDKDALAQAVRRADVLVAASHRLVLARETRDLAPLLEHAAHILFYVARAAKSTGKVPPQVLAESREVAVAVQRYSAASRRSREWRAWQALNPPAAKAWSGAYEYADRAVAVATSAHASLLRDEFEETGRRTSRVAGNAGMCLWFLGFKKIGEDTGGAAEVLRLRRQWGG
jgi:hypothetical protein